MRWVFYSLVVVNLVYLGWQGVMLVVEPDPPAAPASAEAPAAPSGQGLKLLGEAPQPRRGAAPRPATGPGLCPVVGPWSGRGDAERARIQLDAVGLGGRIEAVTVQKDHLNWVYLPPYGTRERALTVLGELQARGVDSFIVKTGEDANAISLGYFSSADSAEGLRVKMRNAGYPAFVRETSRPVTEYWLYLPEAAAGAPELEDFLAGNPDVGRDRAASRREHGGAG